MNHAQYNLKSVALYALVLILTYYLTPNVIETVGDGAVVLLFIIPLVILMSAFAFGRMDGVNLVISLITGLLFIPTIYIFYHGAGWVYVPAYALIALIGDVTGTYVYNTGRLQSNKPHRA